MLTSREFEKAIKGSPRYKQIKWGIFFVGVSVFAQLYNFQPLLPQISSYFQITPSHSSLSVSFSTAGMALGLLVFAFIADQFERKKIILFALFSSTILTLLSVCITQFEFLLLINFIKGACISGVSAVTLAYLAEEIDPSNIGGAISFYLAGNTFGGMAGRIVSALLGDWFGWRIAVLTIGLLSLIIALYIKKNFPSSNFFSPYKRNFKEQYTQMKLLFVNLKITALYIVAVCLMGSFVSVYNYLGFKLEAPPYNLPHSLIAFIFLMYAFGIVGNLLGGSLSDKYAPKKILITALIVVLIGLSFLFSSSLPILISGLMLFTIAFFCAHTLAGRLVTELAQENRTSATAMYWFFYYMGSSIVGSTTGFFINNNNWNGFFTTLILLVLLSLIVVYWTTRPKKT